jgi:hypothetical protein
VAPLRRKVTPQFVWCDGRVGLTVQDLDMLDRRLNQQRKRYNAIEAATAQDKARKPTRETREYNEGGEESQAPRSAASIEEEVMRQALASRAPLIIRIDYDLIARAALLAEPGLAIHELLTECVRAYIHMRTALACKREAR